MSLAPVTVAVVSWNTRDLLARCLESLLPEVEAGRAEVWVVDNASTDGSADLVQEKFAWARLIASPENLGFGTAVNAVASRTDSAWIAPANADIQLQPGALERLLAEGEAHPAAAVLAPRLILPDGRTQQSVYPFPTVPFTLAYVSGAVARSRRLAAHWCIDGGFDPSARRDVGWAIGAFLLVRRDAWSAVGGFDQAQWMYAEDLDLGWRLAAQGWRTRYVPDAPVLHAESAATSQAWGDERHARWHASSYGWLLRRRGLAYARLIAAINVIGFYGRALVLGPIASRGNAKAADARERALGAARAHLVGLRPRRTLESFR